MTAVEELMVAFRTVGPFMEDSRADRVAGHLVTRSRMSSKHWLYLLGPGTAARHVQMCGDGCASVAMTDDRARDYTHRLEFPADVPQEILGLVDLLEQVLTLQTRSNVDGAVALDWYKIPPEDPFSTQWKNTEAGELLYHSKYYNRAPYKKTLVEKMIDVIERHPLLLDAPTVVTVPGHAANGNSFGERLARRLADDTGKGVVNTLSSGPHEESKMGSSHELGDFTIDEALSGDVLVIDDVYRTGGSMNVAAYAAKEAGASRVFGLVVARTLRN